MIDIHSHILPGLDDGAGDTDTALEMVRAYCELGFKKVIATPHIIEKSGYRITHQLIKEKLDALNLEIKKNNLELTILSGGEYYLDQPFIKLAERYWPLTKLNDSCYLMIELPGLFLPDYLKFSILEPKTKNLELKKALPGLRVIIAHPERNEAVAKNPLATIQKLREQGYFIQLNLGSLVGFYGNGAKKAGELLVKNKLVDLVASDAHSPSQLKEIVLPALKVIEKLVGKEFLELMVKINPEKVLKGEYLEAID